MTVKLTNFQKRENSTKTPGSFVVEKECYLKAPSSIMQCVLVFDRAAMTAQYNYVYIPEFKRYYFVTNYIYSGALLEYHLEIDVLASYRDDIRNSSQYVLRSAADYDGNVLDTKYPAKSDPVSYFDAERSPWSDTLSGGCFTMGIVGSDGIHYYLMSESGLSTFFGYLLSDAYANAVIGDLSITNPSLKLAVDPLQYVTGVKWLPFNPGSLGNQIAGGIETGYITIAPNYCYGIAIDGASPAIDFVFHNMQFSQSAHPDASSRGNYLNSAEYTSISIYVPPYGVIDLDASILSRYPGAVVYCEFRTDTRTGECILEVSAATISGGIATKHHIFCHVSFDNSVDIPVTQVIAANGIGVSEILSPVVSAATQAIGGNYVGAAATAITGAASAIESIARSKIPEVRSNGRVESLSVYSTDGWIQYVWYIPVDEDRPQHGRPLCAIRQLSTIPGFVMCANAELSIDGTAGEERQIISYLNSGFFVE